MIKHRRCSCSGGAVCCDIEQGFPLCIVLKSTSLRLLAVMTNDHRATHSRVAPEERRSRNHFDVEASKGVMKGWRAQKAARAYLGQRDRGRQRPNTPTPASMSSRPRIERRRPLTAGDASREKCPPIARSPAVESESGSTGRSKERNKENREVYFKARPGFQREISWEKARGVTRRLTAPAPAHCAIEPAHLDTAHLQSHKQ